jgi:hypothetical protein
VSVNNSVRNLNQEEYRRLAFNDAFEQIWVISKARRHVGKLVSELQKEVQSLAYRQLGEVATECRNLLIEWQTQAALPGSVP